MLVPSEFLFGRQNVPKAFLQASLAGAPRGIALAAFFHLALPFLLRRYGLLRRARAQLALQRRLRVLLAWTTLAVGCTDARLSGLPGDHLFLGRPRQESRHVGASLRGSRHMRAGRWHCRAPSGWQI